MVVIKELVPLLELIDLKYVLIFHLLLKMVRVGNHLNIKMLK